MAQRVFLAEDDDEMRALIRLALERDGCEVYEARDGAELVNLLGKTAETPNDVIVTDVQMPHFSGLGVLRSLRQAHWKVPIILITVDPNAAVKSDAAQWHAIVLKKPFELEDLRMAVVNAARFRDV